MINLRGKTDFYDGWLHYIFNKPLDETKSNAWQLGWKMAGDTPPKLLPIALLGEIESGNIIVN